MDRSVRAWAAAIGVSVAVGGLLLLAAVTAGLPERDGAGLEFDPAGLRDVVLPLIRIAYLAILLSAFYQLLVGRDKAGGKRRRHRVSPVATFLALALVAFTTFFLFGVGDDLAPNILFPQTSGPGSEEDAGGTAGPEAGSVSGASDGGALGSSSSIEALLDNPLFLLLLLVGAAAAAVAMIMRSPVADEGEEEGGPTVPGSPHSVAVPPDIGAGSPHHRVFAAYSRVEDASARRRMERGRAETVSSHLRRLPVDTSAARRLADLYNRARFSPYAIDEALADDAERSEATVTGELS